MAAPRTPASPTPPTALERIRANSDAVMALGAFGVMALLMVPLPPLMLDILLASSITLALLIFLVALYVRKAVEFSVFPTVLLVSTIFRLALNVASTRLILLHGAEGPDAAGHVIQAFGNFVVGGNYVVGFILFAILIVINFVVITKGAGRVAEVAARFTLDAMPGKQMAIDAELNAGLIDEKMAKRRRAEIGREADFYGAMDGASKFIKGDAMAAILITLINIIAGVVIGVVMNGLDLKTALTNYTILTIGDGLVSQIPALIISAGAGILVTRVSDVESSSLESQLESQMLGNPRIIAMLAGLAGIFVLVPGLRVVFAILTVGLVAIAWTLQQPSSQPSPKPDSLPAANTPPVEAPIEDLLKVEPLVLEVGLDLVYLVDTNRSGGLVDRIQRIRRQLAQELGTVIPSVHVRDNLRMAPGQYRVLLRGENIGTGKVMARQNLALDPGTVTGKLPGPPGVDPVFGLKGVWINDHQRIRAQSLGYTVVDVPTVLTTHLDDLFRRHAHELYGRAQLGEVLERVSRENPKLVEELIPEPLSRAVVLKVFRNLIQEGVGVRDVQGILEVLSEYAARTRDPDVLTEFVRQRMARAVTARFVAEDGLLRYLGLAPEVEDTILRGLQGAEGGVMNLVLDPESTRKLIQAVRAQVDNWNQNTPPVLLVPPLARGSIRRLLDRAIPRMYVLSPGEVVPGTPIDRVGEVSFHPQEAKKVAAVGRR
jgi:flagellar biosynthesis protein FlhA